MIAKDEAGYFIRNWPELRDHMRHMVRRDPACQAIKTTRETRSLQTSSAQLFGEMDGIE